MASARKPVFTRALRRATAVLAFVTLLAGCQHCHKCSTLIVIMPQVDAQRTAQPVMIVLHPTGSDAPDIACSWAPSVSPGGSWACTQDSNGATSGHDAPRFAYDVPNAGGNWTITITGPSGTHTVARNSSPGDSGEGAPLECACAVYQIQFTSSDMEGTGVVLGTATGGYVGPDAGP